MTGQVTASRPGRSSPVGRPLVFAHRGASAALPENTLGAYRRALVERADGLECDVRMTRDGALVCVHDRRLERTSDGRGSVNEHTLAQLRRLDFGSWHGTGPAGILTLDELLATVRDWGRPVRLLVETKHPDRYGRRLEPELVRLLHRYGLVVPRPADPVRATVMSFSAPALRRFRYLAPAVPTALLLPLVPPPLRPWRLPPGTRIAGPSIRLVRSRPGLVPELRAAGHQVYVWTVNDPADLTLVLWHGVNGVITDRPGEIRAALTD